MNRELDLLLPAIKQAGCAILQLQKEGLQISHKANSDIVTQADLTVDALIKATLSIAFPTDCWLSEESVDNAERLTAQRVWVVDPIDGTKEYATGVPEFAISVALVENAQPKIGVVYNPATKELFYAVRGQGCFLNENQVTCLSGPATRLNLLASRSEYKRGEWTQFELQHDVQQVGSIAYKLALIAAGRAHATFSLGPKSEWDIAAGVLLVQEAGGIATDKLGKSFTFNNKNVLVDGIVATTPQSSAQVFALFK